MFDAKATSFKPIELAWAVLMTHKELYDCSQARLMPNPDGSLHVHCPVHGLIQEDGEPAEK